MSQPTAAPLSLGSALIGAEHGAAGPRRDKGYVLDLMSIAHARGASDLHVKPSELPWLRVDGEMRPMVGMEKVDDQAITHFLGCGIFSKNQIDRLSGLAGHCEGRYDSSATGPVRLQAFREQNGTTLSMRLLSAEVPKLETLGLPDYVESLPDIRNGLVLFTGETGAGKSTALAAVIDKILDTRSVNILCFEDPIEYMHRTTDESGSPRRGMIRQVTIGRDVQNYEEALRSALRSDPDVLMIGEMRDQRTILAAVEIAETGHLVFSTGHDQRTLKTVERLVNSFDPSQEKRVRYSLAHCLRAIVSLRLLPRSNGRGRVSCAEVLVMNDGLRHLIEQGKINELANALSQGRPGSGMQTLEDGLARLVASGKITSETAKAEVETEKLEQLKEMFVRHGVKW
jgi:twitching motility protein PilT